MSERPKELQREELQRENDQLRAEVEQLKAQIVKERDKSGEEILMWKNIVADKTAQLRERDAELADALARWKQCSSIRNGLADNNATLKAELAEARKVLRFCSCDNDGGSDE